MKLCIGSGSWHWGGDWIMLDGDTDNHPDVVATVPPLPDAIKVMRFDFILMSHFVEHLTRQDALILIKECYEILDEGGVIEFDQPNMDYCCRVYLGYIDPPEGYSREQMGIQGIYGEPYVHPLMGHKYGYTPETLTKLVVEAGFNQDGIMIEQGHYHIPIRDFTLVAIK